MYSSILIREGQTCEQCEEGIWTACPLTPTTTRAHCVADDHIIDSERCVLTNETVLMLTVGQERSLLIEIDVGSRIRAVGFTANAEYIAISSADGVGVWRVKDGKQMAKMAVENVCSLTVLKDGRWVAVRFGGEAIMWDAKTFKKVFTVEDDIVRVDFLPDSTRLLIGLESHTATVWNVTTHQKILTLGHHGDWVRAAKYSPQGDGIATATHESV